MHDEDAHRGPPGARRSAPSGRAGRRCADACSRPPGRSCAGRTIGEPAGVTGVVPSSIGAPTRRGASAPGAAVGENSEPSGDWLGVHVGRRRATVERVGRKCSRRRDGALENSALTSGVGQPDGHLGSSAVADRGRAVQRAWSTPARRRRELLHRLAVERRLHERRPDGRRERAAGHGRQAAGAGQRHRHAVRVLLGHQHRGGQLRRVADEPRALVVVGRAGLARRRAAERLRGEAGAVLDDLRQGVVHGVGDVASRTPASVVASSSRARRRSGRRPS